MRDYDCKCELTMWLDLGFIEGKDAKDVADYILNMPLKDLLKEEVESYEITDLDIE